ncbi:hypothetical protein [Roseovarius nitratireducens]|uniref:hypothetical protein n=1 Tax=Roseovarius nitratireducens TaxID=2044597 RepID=UPI001F0BF1E0|nr:hypothetical protein [Roseovarius nitratireducens]
MDDKYMGGVLAFIIAAPIMVIRCGGGGVIFAAILGGLGGCLSGLGGIATVIAAFGVVLLLREIRRHRAIKADGPDDVTCCLPKATAPRGPAETGHQ